MGGWIPALELNSDRSISKGSQSALRDAIRGGADMRIYTEFRHNEHVDVSSDNPEIVREVAEFRATYLVDDRWVAGIMTLRQPVSLPDGFVGGSPSMSFFMYNEDGRQAIARPHMDGRPTGGKLGPDSRLEVKSMRKYHQLDGWDPETISPSSNFVYDFDIFRYWVRNDWQEVLAHDADGNVEKGSVDALGDAFSQGCEVKVAVSGLCSDLAESTNDALPHELFIQINSCYYYTEQKVFIGATHPMVRVSPSIPMEYRSKGWDFGWIVARTDGHIALRLVDPYTLEFKDSKMNRAVRWFVR